jgi:hypothetical protein
MIFGLRNRCMSGLLSFANVAMHWLSRRGFLRIWLGRSLFSSVCGILMIMSSTMLRISLSSDLQPDKSINHARQKRPLRGVCDVHSNLKYPRYPGQFPERMINSRNLSEDPAPCNAGKTGVTGNHQKDPFPVQCHGLWPQIRTLRHQIRLFCFRVRVFGVWHRRT